jgi:hypothetical protein
LFRLGRLEKFLALHQEIKKNSSFVIQVLAREEQADDLREDGRGRILIADLSSGRTSR